VAAWPRRGTPVVFREPGTGDLAITRVAARPGDWVPFADSWLQLGPDEAWLLGDASDERVQEAGYPPPVDSRRYGPVTVEALVARAWFRYWPVRRLGLIGRAPADLLERGREGRIPVTDDGPEPEVPAPGIRSADGGEDRAPGTVA
jgi:hypothetical protein